MTASTTIVAYLGAGLHSARPASPTPPAGGTVIYYETDTTNTFIWSGSAWVQINVAAGGPSIVQNASNVVASGAISVTMGSAPTLNNLLIAFVGSTNTPIANTGWNLMAPLNSAGVDYGGIFWKVAGASESTTQTPVSTTGVGGATIYEISSGAPSIIEIGDATSASTNYDTESTRAGGLLIGALYNQGSTALPTAITGMAADSTASAGSRSIAGFHNASQTTQGNNNVAYTYAGSTHAKQFGLVIF